MRNQGKFQTFLDVVFVLLICNIGLSSCGRVLPSSSRCPRSLQNGSLTSCAIRNECEHDEDCEGDLRTCCPDQCGKMRCWVPWLTRQRILNSPLCNDVVCTAQGSRCVEIEGIAECICNDNCQQLEHQNDIVCGSDGMTYMTRCAMDWRACSTGTRITVTECNTVPTPNTILRTSSMASDEIEVRAPKLLSFPTPITIPRTSVTRRISCMVTGHPKPAIFWKVKDEPSYLKPGQTHGRFTFDATTADLVIQNIQITDSGTYTCVAANSAGAITVNFTVHVEGEDQGSESKVDCYTHPHFQKSRCRGSYHRIERLWIYDPNTNLCTFSFIRNCEKVTNKFSTKEECSKTCMEDCKMPVVRGPCKRFEPRLYFNPATRECEPFSYGGCEGNNNNFRTVEECKMKCLPEQAKSILPFTPECGICRQDIGSSYCSSDFIIVAKFTRFRSRNSENEETTATLSRILKASSPTVSALLNAKLDRTLNILFRTGTSCPCPDLKKILRQNTNQHEIHIQTSRKKSSSHSVNLMLMGRAQNGVLTIDQSSYVAIYNDKDENRITSMTVFTGFCDLLNQVNSQF